MILVAMLSVCLLAEARWLPAPPPPRPAIAGRPYLVMTAGGDLSPGFEVNGRYVFSVYGRGGGGELWATDGTARGSVLLASGQPFVVSSYAVVNKQAFFTRAGGGLWKTDGTPQGTLSVKGSMLYVFADSVGNDGTFFGTTGGELWKSDGTEAGTVLVKSINPGRRATRVGTALVFAADEWINGIEPWISDGTDAGTHLLKDVLPGPGSSLRGAGFLEPGLRVGRFVLFGADDGTHGLELWRTDGTAEGTTLVTDHCPGACDGVGTGPVVNGALLFEGGTWPVGPCQLWRTDGTEGGTRLVRSGSPCFGGPRYVDGPVFFRGTGTEIWQTDGTLRGTHRVALTPHGPQQPGFDLLGAGSLVFFGFFTMSDGVELWVAPSGTPGARRTRTRMLGHYYISSLLACAPSQRRLFFDQAHELWAVPILTDEPRQRPR